MGMLRMPRGYRKLTRFDKCRKRRRLLRQHRYDNLIEHVKWKHSWDSGKLLEYYYETARHPQCVELLRGTYTKIDPKPVSSLKALA